MRTALMPVRPSRVVVLERSSSDHCQKCGIRVAQVRLEKENPSLIDSICPACGYTSRSADGQAVYNRDILARFMAANADQISWRDVWCSVKAEIRYWLTFGNVRRIQPAGE